MMLIEKPSISGQMMEIIYELLEQAHHYLLQSTIKVHPYFE